MQFEITDSLYFKTGLNIFQGVMKENEAVSNISQYTYTIHIRVFHENMFFRKKISATHHASAWGNSLKESKRIFDFDQV